MAKLGVPYKKIEDKKVYAEKRYISKNRYNWVHPKKENHYQEAVNRAK